MQGIGTVIFLQAESTFIGNDITPKITETCSIGWMVLILAWNSIGWGRGWTHSVGC